MSCRRDPSPAWRLSSEQGTALLTTILVLLLLSAVAFGLSTTVRVEAAVAGRFADGARGLYAAEAAFALAVSELRGMGDWGSLLSGAVTSPRSDGPFAGSRRVTGGGAVMLCCSRDSVLGRLNRESAASPMQARRSLPWHPYLWTPAGAIAPALSGSRLYLTVFLQDDEEEADGDGRVDVNRRVVLRAEAVDPDGLRRAVEGLLEHVPPEPVRGLGSSIRLLNWREAR